MIPTKQMMIHAFENDWYLQAVYGLVKAQEEWSWSNGIECFDHMVAGDHYDEGEYSPFVLAVIQTLTMERKRSIIPYLLKLGYSVCPYSVYFHSVCPFSVFLRVPVLNECIEDKMVLLYSTKYSFCIFALAFAAKLRVLVKKARRDAIMVAFTNKGLKDEALHLIFQHYVVGKR
jgi:hypothetical protein